MKNDYIAWLQANFQSGTCNTQMSQARRIEEIYGDLDAHYDRDEFASILADLAYTSSDKAAGKANSSRVAIEGDKLYESLAHLRSALGYYSRFRTAKPGQKAIVSDWPQLDEMRKQFLMRCPDFIDFSQNKGSYYDKERAYKDALIHKARTVMGGTDRASEERIGQEFLALIKESNFVGWRAFAQMDSGGVETQTKVAVALGQMLLSKEDSPGIIQKAAEQIHPVLQGGSMGNPAFGQVRTLVTCALALARPSDSISIKTQAMQRAAKALTGQGIFKSAVISADEYKAFLDLSLRIQKAFSSWGWKPRDLWDVQGFLWVANCENWGDAANSLDNFKGEEKDDDLMVEPKKHPLNQILFGPPGTGKTWTTARMAVEICNGSAPADRDELMQAYNELVKTNRITFTTFHQSIGYEEFVECLRPVTDSDDDMEEPVSAGFRLEPRNGIFRDICVLAENARKRGGKSGKFDFTGRQFFKMSLGRAKTEGHIYQAAIEGNYLVLGWGGNIDWSGSQYNEYKAVFDRWQEEEPGATGNNGNISQIWKFRSLIKKGDIVIVSDGNFKFRAIAEIVGDYQYVPQDEGGNHRRAVKWLAVFDESLPIETIHDGKLVQASCYQLVRSRMKLDALGEHISEEGSSSALAPESYVLIIDEINRANVSKVLGELITLLESDKRLGGKNPLTVKLPYSGDNFGVPNNLYVIGTMNTADRSIALLDTALRRRFHFTEMMPDYTCINKEVDGIHLGDLLSAINRRIEWLFDRDHQIGHAFFTGIEDKATLDQIMQNKIIPLLIEYFYEDWEKVRAVLNDRESCFIDVQKLPLPPMLQMDGDTRSRYSIKKGEISLNGYLAAIELA